MQNFLAKLQDRYFILLCFFVVLGIYIFIRLDAILQLAINFGVAIIALSQKKQEPTMHADTLQTDTVTATTMPDANITTNEVNTQPDPEPVELVSKPTRRRTK